MALGFFSWLADKINWRRLRRRVKARDLAPAEDTHFTVLVCDLAGDDDGSQTRHVADALAGQGAIGVRQFGRCLDYDDLGDIADNIAAAESKGRDWLAGQNADILIWGRVKKADEVLALRILSGSQSESPTGQSYRLTQETVELPANFGEDLAAVLTATALAGVAPVSERQGHYLVDVLRPVAAKLAHLRTDPPHGLTPEQRGAIDESFGHAAAVLGEQSGEYDWLEQAISAFHAALEVRTRERVPLDWAMTQSNLGYVLRALGEREEGTERLAEAVAAYRAALEVYTRERVPLDWAMTQNNLGTALSRLGEREEGAERLAEAVAAYRAALEVYTRERVPLGWATTQNNLGATLRNLGEREESTEQLAEAVAAYRAALEVHTRERVPLDWAMTQNNLGNVLRILGEREEGTERLEEAVASHRAALEVFESAATTYYVRVVRDNLNRAEGVLKALRKRRKDGGDDPIRSDDT